MVWLRLWEYRKFLFWSEKNPSVFSTEIFPVRTNTEVCWATYILTEYWQGPDRESVFLPYWLFFSSSVLTFSYAYPLEGCGGSSLSREICFLPSHVLHLSRGTLRRSHAGPVTLGLHHCLLPIRHVGNTWEAPRRPTSWMPKVPQLAPIAVKLYTLRPSQTTELFILSPLERPETAWRKYISATSATYLWCFFSNSKC